MHAGDIGQGEKLFADSSEELFVVAAGEVGPADTTLKKGVAAENGIVSGEVESNGVGRVTRDVEEGDFFQSEVDDVAICKGLLGPKGGNADGKAEGAGDIFADDCRVVIRVRKNAEALRGEGGNVFYVVEMLMREKKVRGIKAAFEDELSHASGGVDDEAGVFRFNEEAVSLDGAAGEGLNVDLGHDYFEGWFLGSWRYP